jgi:hypothetical protein
MSRQLLGLLVGLACSLAHAEERRVAPGGRCTDLGPGSPSRPWCTLAAAGRRAAPGDRVRIAAGVWHEPLSIQVSGLPGRPILFEGEGERTVLDGVGASTPRVEVARRSHLVIRALSLRGALRAREGSDLRVERLRVAAIRCERASRVQIVGNRVDGAAGIEIAASEDFLIAGNRLAGGGGLGALQGPLRGELRENEVRGARNAGVLLQRARQVKVLRNRLHGCAVGIRVEVDDREGAALRASQGNELFQNVIRASRGAGIELRRSGSATLAATRIFNNLIRESGASALVIDGATSTLVANNILSANRGTIAGSSVAASTITHNLFHANGAPAIGKAAQTADPAFRSVARGDFRLGRASPAIDAGTLMGLPYAGRAPDLGPFERTE